MNIEFVQILTELISIIDTALEFSKFSENDASMVTTHSACRPELKSAKQHILSD